MKNRIFSYGAVILGLLVASCKIDKVVPPEPFGPVPSVSQMEWQKMEYYMFIHFGPNTFTDREWGDGKEDPRVFYPTDLDCRQWAATAKAAGMKGIIITAKHHDGFCLWPSRYSTHTVRESAWKDGQGDVLKELSDACREYGLRFGVYLSPWDQNHPEYGSPQYNEVFANTLSEVLTGYGPVFEQWFDGAHGEGEKKQIYDWDLFHKTVYKHQPDAIIFSDIGPGCRWIGNEQGYAGETNWSRLDIEGFEPGSNPPPIDTLNQGNKFGAEWVPGEADVSIRPGWFYSPSTDEKVKSVEQLLKIYYASVGRNATLLLNVPPDRRGRIHPNDSTRLMEFRKAIDEIFEVNLAENGVITSSSTRGGSSRFAASNLLDDNYDTYWTTDDTVLNAHVVLELKKPETFNRLMLQEYIPLGQRVSTFNVKFWNEKTESWTIFAEATTIGYKRILKFPSITTGKIKINIINSLACPIINNVGLYYAQEDPAAPLVERDKKGDVFIRSQPGNQIIYYTLDGTEPTVNSSKYSNPFSLSKGGTVKAFVVTADGARSSEVVTLNFDIAPAKWRVVSPQSQTAENAIDNNPNTWANLKRSEPLVVDLGENLQIKGFYYVPVSSETAANISRYNFYVSTDGKEWITVKKDASFDNIRNNPIRQNTLFAEPAKAKYIKMEPVRLSVKRDQYAVKELGVITR